MRLVILGACLFLFGNDAVAQSSRPDPPAICNAWQGRFVDLSSRGEQASIRALLSDVPIVCRNLRSRIQHASASDTSASGVPSGASVPSAEIAPSAPPTTLRLFRDCADCPEMVVVPSGSFTMGSPTSEIGRGDEGPQRRLNISAFAIGKFEVTVAQFAAFVRSENHLTVNDCYTDRANTGYWDTVAAGSWRAPGFYQTDDRPVTCVTWEDANAYIQWLNARTEGGYRLPSEAEWEYAARGGDRDGPYPWGASASHDFANYGADVCCRGLESGRDRWVYTSPVGSFPPNPFGIFDMHGNLSEWAQDCYEPGLAAIPNDGSAYETTPCLHALRGGAWRWDPEYVRTAHRGGSGSRTSVIGFRVARTLSP